MPRSGASYSSAFEQEESARWRGLTPAQFNGMDGVEQSRVVAHYRAHHQLEAVISQAQQREAKRRKR